MQAEDALHPPREIVSELSATTVRVQRSRGWPKLRFGELWHYRELLFFLTWRDLKVRYKQTALGVAWAILQPLAAMLVFSLFFGRLAKLPSDGIPYPLFSYSGLVLWTFFSGALVQASNSLISSASLITKVYFPRLLIPLGTVTSALVDLFLSSLLLVGLMAYYDVVPTARALLVPVFVLMTFATALGVGLWLSALNVQYRDVRYLVPFLTQFWLFATPIVYPSTLLDEPWRTLYGLNPMVGAVEGFRWALVGTDTSPGPMVLVSAAITLLLLASGAFYFRWRERRFADVI